MRYVILLICMALVFLVSGCGQMTGTRGDVTEKTFISKANNPQVREFNKQLGAISDEASAGNAVNSFVGYVGSRLDKSASGTTVQSLGALLSPAVLQKIAKKEALARKVGSSVCSDDNSDAASLVDVGTITDNINALGASGGVKVDDDIVSKVQTAVESSMPNINPDNNPGMTPLEASVVGYTLVSGDDGTASAESVSIPVDKMNDFVGSITQ